MQIKRIKNKTVLVAGCGRFGASIALELNKKGYDVTIIDKDKKAFNRLSESFGGFEICGDASDMDLLQAQGIAMCEMVVIATDNDNVNCMIAQIANSIFNIFQVYVRLNDPEKYKVLEGTTIRAIYPARLSIQEFECISNIHFDKKEYI